MQKLLAVVPVFCALILLSANSQAELRKWSVYESENFSVYTDLTEKGARHLVEEFETFREAVFTLLGLPQRSENKRL